MRNRVYFLIILCIGIVIKMVTIQNLPFDSDQAIVGLMGKHIMSGAFPWLYYGDSYGGILEPLLVSWSFLFFGISRLSLHLIPSIFSILFIISIYQLGRELYDRKIGLLSMLLSAVPFFSPGLYLSLAYGGYIEILWLGNLILLITHRLAPKKEKISFIPLFFLGLLWGISWWTYPISVVYLICSFCFLLYFRMELIWKVKALSAALGFFLGSMPFWTWNGIHRFPFLGFSQSQEHPDFSYRISRFVHQFLDFFKAGMEGETSLITSALAVLFVASLLFLLVLLAAPKWFREKFPSSRGPALLLLFFLSFCFCYVGSRFSEQNAPRYLLPLFSLIPISLAFFCFALKTIRKEVSIGMMTILILINVYHQMALSQYLKDNSIRYQKQQQVEGALFDFLHKKKYTHCYEPAYWSGPRLTFTAKETLVFAAPFGDRYPFYTLMADASSLPVFVVEGMHQQVIDEMLKSIGGTYEKKIFAFFKGVIGYVVYHNFQPPVSDGLEILPDLWKGKSSNASDPVDRAFDRSISSAWSSSSSQQPGMYFQIDLGGIYNLNRILLLCGKGKEWNFPSQYRIELSRDEKAWEEITAVKNQWAYLFWSNGRPFWKLRDGRMEINFDPKGARFVRITVTGPAPQPWSIGEIFVYQTAQPGHPTPVSPEEFLSFFSKEKIEYVYADIGLSAQITHLTGGKIKCLQEDYDITTGGEYGMAGYNGAYPFLNNLKKQVDFSIKPAFVVARENIPSFQRTMDQRGIQYRVEALGDQRVYFNLKFPATPKTGNRQGPFHTLYWTGTHLLKVEP
jgi:hypothetical protein